MSNSNLQPNVAPDMRNLAPQLEAVMRAVEQGTQENQRLRQQVAILQRPPEFTLVADDYIIARGKLIGHSQMYRLCIQFETVEEDMTLSELFSSKLFLAGRDDPIMAFDAADYKFDYDSAGLGRGILESKDNATLLQLDMGISNISMGESIQY